MLPKAGRSRLDDRNLVEQGQPETHSQDPPSPVCSCREDAVVRGTGLPRAQGTLLIKTGAGRLWEVKGAVAGLGGCCVDVCLLLVLRLTPVVHTSHQDAHL